MEEQRKRYSWKQASLAIGLVVLVVGVWIVVGWWLPDSLLSDHFGAVDALFAGLAFVGLIFAILLQSEELALQRGELELTRNEIKGQKEQLELQNKTLFKQSLENTFFQLLRLHIEIVSAIDLTDIHTKSVKSKGRDCFNEFYNQLRKDYAQVEHDTPDESTRIEQAYGRFFARNQADLGHYFRNLYHVLKFVSELPLDNKQFYVNLVVAQLSSHELAMLFYNCLSEYGRKRFKPIIERFGVLENMSTKLLLAQDHLSLYERTAYGGSKKAANGS